MEPAPAESAPDHETAAVGEALSEIADLLADADTARRAGRSMSPGNHAPVAVALPARVDDVRRLVDWGRRHGIALYPISRGRNWGYGSATPSGPNQVVVDLSRMNRIHEVNAHLGFAVIEPGVTQKQLYDHLRQHAPNLMIDATGAATDASFVGNTLDRGFGHTPYGDHCGHACAFQVVLGDSSILETGYARFPDARASHVYRYGVGPSLDGLFSQSNFGIITRLTVWLMPRPETFTSFLCQTPDDDALPALLDALADLRRRDLVRSAVHLGNDLRIISARRRYPFDRAEGATPLPDDLRRTIAREESAGAWNAAGGIYGPRRVVQAVKAEVRRVLSPFGVKFVDERTLRMGRAAARAGGWLPAGRRLGRLLDLFEPVYGLMTGVPTDDAIQGTLWRVRDPLPPLSDASDLLDSPAGMMWVAPVLPATGYDARHVVEIMDPIYRAHGFDTLISFTLISERAAICVSNVAFDRREAEETQRAQACYHALWDALLPQGYIPYRAGHAGQARLRAEPSTFNDTCRRLKTALDPDHIIAPGRYVD